jgi:hypothetical protein
MENCNGTATVSSDPARSQLPGTGRQTPAFCLDPLHPDAGALLAFILLIAFAPGWLGTPLSEGSSITRGIPVGIGLIVSAFVLTGIYVFRANGEFDELNQKILKGAQS